ncbi:hypothetical protein D3C78_1799120 [compost metagenome]
MLLVSATVKPLLLNVMLPAEDTNASGEPPTCMKSLPPRPFAHQPPFCVDPPERDGRRKVRLF